MSRYMPVTFERLRAAVPATITADQIAYGISLLTDGVKSSTDLWKRLLMFFESLVRLPHFVDPQTSTVRYGATNFVVMGLDVWLGEGEIVAADVELLARIVAIVRAEKRVPRTDLATRLGVNEQVLAPHLDALVAEGAIAADTGDADAIVVSTEKTSGWLRSRAAPEPAAG